MFSIALRFRRHQFVFATDIEKMYRTVCISPEDSKYQKILWREDPSQPIRTYRIVRVIYGTRSGAFLATRTIVEIASIVQKSGDEKLAQDLVSIQKKLVQIFQNAGMKLRQWASNSKKLLENVPIVDREVDLNSMNVNETIKTLGLIWNPHVDDFRYKVPDFTNSNEITKRQVTSDVTKLFDPLGLLAPVVILAKCFVQRLWLEQVDWDDILSEQSKHFWLSFRDNLSSLASIRIPRLVVPKDTINCQLHGFADASEAAYGACDYLRCEDSDGKITVSLLCSKSRVAPIKSVSLARLELCAAVLLVELTQKVVSSLKLSFDSVHFWSDSTIVLNWIVTPPFKLKTFVSNRVSRIQE